MLGINSRYQQRPSKTLFMNIHAQSSEFREREPKMLGVNPVGGSFKSFFKKFKNVGKKIFKSIGKVGDFVLNANKKIINTLGTNDNIRNIVGAVPVVGDTINTLTKIGSDAMKAADTVANNIKNKKPILDGVDTSQLKQDVSKAKDDKNISKWIDEAKKLANETVNKIKSSNLPQSDKDEVVKAAGLLNYDIFNSTSGRLACGRIAKSFKYLPLIKLSDIEKDNRVNIPKNRLKAIGEEKAKTISPKNSCGRLFLNGSQAGKMLQHLATSSLPLSGEVKKNADSKNLLELLTI